MCLCGSIFSAELYLQSVTWCTSYMQRAAIDSALSLISDALVNLDNTFQLINSPVSAATLLELVEVADKRADDVSGLARRLLNILQNHSEAESEDTRQGVTHVSLTWFVLCSLTFIEAPALQAMLSM
jgi:hypothetical protein